MTIQAGTTFAGYHIDRLLGSGGMGEVYLANHPHLPRQEAVKVLADTLSSSQQYRKQFLAEADFACRLRHPNVVAVHDRGEFENRLWISMDYIQGRDLDRAINDDGAFSLGRTVNILRGIASAVQDLHDNRLLHRDIKPANILLTNMRGVEQAFLTDFGIARELADQLGLTATSTSAAMTMPYAAPERLSLPGSQLDQRVDVYSLGCVLFEMLTGRRAFPQTDLSQLMYAISNEYPSPPSRLVPGLPRSVDQVVFRALAKNRDERYRSCTELLRAFEDVLVPTPPPFRPKLPLAVTYRGAQASPIQVVSDRLSVLDRDRLLQAVVQSQVFTLPAAAPSGSWQGGRQELVVTAANGHKVVSWQGIPPVQVQPLCQLVGELAPRRRSRKPWIIATAALSVLAALAALLLVVVLPKPKPAIPLPATALSTTAEHGAIKLHWTEPATNVDHFILYRDGRQVTANLHGNTFVDKLSDTKAHRYFLVTVSPKDKVSPHSATVSGTADLRNLNAAETTFIRRLPSAIVDKSTCIPSVGLENEDIDVAVSCSLLAGSAPAGTVVPTGAIIAFHNVSQTAFAHYVGLNQTGLTTGVCNDGPHKDLYTEHGVTAGHDFCYFNGRSPVLGWTNDKNFATMLIFGTDGAGNAGLTSLYNYWWNASTDFDS